MKELQVGDYVCHKDYKAHRGIIGCIVGVTASIRDYNCQGEGVIYWEEDKRGYTIFIANLSELVLVDEDKEPDHKHRMGLDPEEVDWEAHHAFLRERR